MSWNNSVYTTLGTAMLSEALAGKGMNFTRAVSGAGTMAAAELSNATAVTDQRQTLAVASIKETGEDEDATRTIKIQITNAGLTQGYVLHQIGIYAELVGSDSDALAVILQDERGIEIPSETENADFVMEFYAMLAISGAAQIAIAADPNVVATEKRVREMISEHDKDPNAHADVISAALSAAIKKLEDSGQIMDEVAAKKFVHEMLDQYGAAKDISFEDTYETGASNLQEALDKVLGNTLPKLTVETVSGSSLTITDGQSTITGTAGSDGSYTVTLPRIGLWTVTAKLAGLSTDDTIDARAIGGAYTLSLPYFVATISATAAPGAVVAATLPDGRAYTATAGDDGVAQVKVKRSGSYTLSASKDGATSDTTDVSVTENAGEYTATVHFCRIVLTAPTGSTITAVCGDAALTATVTGTGETGTVTLYPPAFGSWKITATKGEETTTETVSATEYKDYPLALAYVKIYGVVWDKTGKTTLTRTDDAALFADPTPALSGKGGNSPFDNCLPWSGMVKETRSAGVLVKIPKYWYKWTQEGGKLKLQIADRKVAGFCVSPAHADRGDGKGERDYVYVGRYKCASDYKSKSGASPKTNITRASFRSGIHALGDTIWQWDFAMFWTIRMLYLVEFADWDGQKVIGFNCGNGSNVQTMGTTDSMTYHTGTMQSSRSTYGVGVQYRWIEDPWGNALEWCDGIYFSGSSVYCIQNPAKFSDSSGGTKIGTRPTSDGYISDWSLPTAAGFEYALYPSAVNGSETTYIADYCYYDSGGVVLCVGGNCSQSRNRGPFYLNGNYAASNYNTNIGSRLLVEARISALFWRRFSRTAR